MNGIQNSLDSNQVGKIFSKKEIQTKAYQFLI